jgi:hypothetical protein
MMLMPMTDRELFARLIKCEAGGEGEDGMKAVATVIMNRVHIDRGEYLRTGQGMVGNSLPGRLKFAPTFLGTIFRIRISITSPGFAPFT